MAKAQDAILESSWRVLESPPSDEHGSRARATAVLNLARAASGSPPANSEDIVREVVAAVQDRSVPVRRSALRLLEWFARRPAAEAFGDHTQLVCRAVGDALSDDVVAVRCWAARVITCLGPDAAEEVEKVHAAVRDTDAAVRCLACGALARLGRFAAGLAASYVASVAWSLKDEDVEVRRAAAFALAQLGDIANGYGAYIARTLQRRPMEHGGGLIEPDVEVRRLCVSTLERLGDQASSFAPELVSALESDPDVVVRRWAIRALEHAARTRHLLRLEDQEQTSPMKAIVKRIVDPDPIVRQWVLLTLARFGKDAAAASEVVRAITQGLNDQELLAVRCIACGAAAQFRETASLAKHHSTCISEALGSSDRELKRTGALALALMGPSAPQAAEQVFITLQDQDVVVRRGAARALEQFRSMNESDISKAVRHIRDQDTTVRLCALRALGQMDRHAEGYAQQVCDLLEEEDTHPAVVLMATWALPRLGGKGKVLMHDHRNFQEAKKIAAEKKNTLVGECYRGMGEMIWNFRYAVKQKVREHIPERLEESSRRFLGFREATMTRFKG